MPHYVYILRCGDGSYYVGHTADLAERIVRHNAGRGPAYTVARRPVEMAYSEALSSIDAALQREAQLKRWTREKKEALIAGDTESLRLSAKRHRP
jgi:tRNA/rRNA methyltransferase